MNELKKPLIFTAIMIPIACIAGYFLAIYQLDMFAGAMLDEAIAEIGSKDKRRAQQTMRIITEKCRMMVVLLA